MVTVSINNMAFGYSKKNIIFDDINIDMNNIKCSNNKGSIYILMGTSGCGKSTFLKLLAGIEKPDRGDIVIKPNGSLVSLLPQESVLFEHLSRENNAKYFSYIKNLQPYFSNESYNKFKSQLKLSDVIDIDSNVLLMSGGEKQRLSLLRALSIKPKILLLDEPCTGLDISVKMNFLNLLRQITDELGLLVIYVTHHMNEAKLIGDKIIYIKSENENYAKVITSSIYEFSKSPPTIEAALLINGLEYNCIPYNINKNEIMVDNKYIIGKIESFNSEFHKKGYLLCPHSQIVYHDNQGLPVKIVGKSLSNIFLKYENESLNFFLSGPISNNNPSEISIIGNIILYDIDGQKPQKASILST